MKKTSRKQTEMIDEEERRTDRKKLGKTHEKNPR